MAAYVSMTEGSKLLLQSDDGLYEGILHKASADKITLEKGIISNKFELRKTVALHPLSRKAKSRR